MPTPDPGRTIAVPANLENLADFRGWLLGPAPGEDPSGIEIDLSRWRRVTPNPLAGLVAVAASHASRGSPVHIEWPADLRARQMLHSVGFAAALRAFGDWGFPETEGRLDRIVPIIPMQNFRTTHEVQGLGDALQDQFLAIDALPTSLVGDASTVLTEAADNVVWHAECEEGGFALAWMRRRRQDSVNRLFIEIAVADAGRGIRASLGDAGEDRDAIERAMQGGVTGAIGQHRGYGLMHVLEAMRAPGRLLTVHSGDGFVAREVGYDRSRQTGARFPGTLITASIRAG